MLNALNPIASLIVGGIIGLTGLGISRSKDDKTTGLAIAGAGALTAITAIPAIGGLAGWLLLKEPIGARLALGAAVSLLGTAIVTFNDWGQGGHALSGDLLALAGAATVSGYLLIGRRQRQRLGLIPYIAVVYTTAALVLLLLALASGHPFTGYGRETYFLFVLLALGPQLLGHSSFNYALKRVSPAIVALALLAEPIGSSVLAYVILREVPAPALFAGAAVILSGIVVAAWPRAEAETQRHIPDTLSTDATCDRADETHR